MDLHRIHRLVSSPRLFDHAVVSATHQGTDALLSLLALLQGCPAAPDTLARQGWVLFQLEQDDDARLLLEKQDCLLAKGYLARVLLLVAKSPQQQAMFLDWAKSQPRIADSITDVEGIVHLDIACAAFLIALQREEEAEGFLVSAARNAELIGLNSVLANCQYQQAGRLWVQQKYVEAAPLLSAAASTVTASRHLVGTATRLLFWTCLLGGAPVPDGAPHAVQAAFQVVHGGPGIPVDEPEVQCVMDAWAALRRLLNFTVKKFPVEAGKRRLGVAKALLERVLEFEDRKSPNVYLNPVLGILRVVACAVLRDPRVFAQAEALRGQQVFGMHVLECMRGFALLQASVSAGTILFSPVEVGALLASWKACSNGQRGILRVFVWEFCPSAAFVLGDQLSLWALKSHPVVHISDGVAVLDHEVVGVPRAPLRRYVAALGSVSQADLKKLEGCGVRQGYRVHVEEWSRPVRQAVQQALLELVPLKNVR